MIYPPFCTICKIELSSSNSLKAQTAAQKLFNILNNNKSMIIFGPIESRIFKLDNKYRYQIMIKFRNKKEERLKLKNAFEAYYREKEARGVTMTPDIIS